MTIEEIEEVMRSTPATLEELHDEIEEVSPEYRAMWEPVLSRLRRLCGN